MDKIYWPTYVYEVYQELCKMAREKGHGEPVTMQDAFREASQRRTSGEYNRVLDERRKWCDFVRSVGADMKRTHGPSVDSKCAVAEASRLYVVN